MFPINLPTLGGDIFISPLRLLCLSKMHHSSSVNLNKSLKQIFTDWPNLQLNKWNKLRSHQTCLSIWSVSHLNLKRTLVITKLFFAHRKILTAFREHHLYANLNLFKHPFQLILLQLCLNFIWKNHLGLAITSDQYFSCIVDLTNSNSKKFHNWHLATFMIDFGLSFCFKQLKDLQSFLKLRIQPFNLATNRATT